MRKQFAVIFYALMAMHMAMAGNNICDMPGQDENVQIPSPFKDCNSLKEAEDIAGFVIEVPGDIEGYDNPVISAIKDDLIQIMYYNGDESIIIRKGTGSSDISGDYNIYEENKIIRLDGTDVSVKGNKGKACCAIWNVNGYSYSVSAPGISLDEMKKIIKAVK